MRGAMAGAEVGDEQREGDPTSDRLCADVAEMLGKEAAVFLPSGTMCNLIAASIHCRSGEVIIADRSAHVIASELGGAAVVPGALTVPVNGRRGQFSFAEVEAVLEGLVGSRAPRPRLLWVEQTHNRGGGSVWPVSALSKLAQAAREHGLATHMDGARLLNAVVASGAPAAQHVADFDTVWIDFSKGLGCPAGAVLAGTTNLIRDAEVWKRRLGGALRQSGILAAAALHALHGFEKRLAQDHVLARSLAAGLSKIPGIALLYEPVETNLVFVDLSAAGVGAVDLRDRLSKDGIRVGAESGYVLRFVTHSGIGLGDVREVVERLGELLAISGDRRDSAGR
jgi:threonine aldolase